MTMKKRRKWKPAPAELIKAFEASVTRLPDIAQRKMFGYPAAYVNGYLFAGLFENSMVVKLPAESRSELLKLPGATCFEPVPGRTMGEFVVVPPSVVKSRARLKPWLESAYAYVKSFPPKVKKKRLRSSR
jgi:TfoX/Sxy family transcriptional regulator of competence genes